ncbi:MAG: YceI family protein, partial [Bacteroidota bacterium]
MSWKIWFPVYLCCLAIAAQGQTPSSIYKSTSGEAYFKSDAPLEVIEARSTQLRGIIDASKYTFAFSIPIRSFEGFNSPLQREHFNENYLESDKFPKATFLGKMIEKIDLSKDGNHEVRAKGQLQIHGIVTERIIKSQLEVKAGQLFIRSAFTVLLKEHDIKIP